MQTLTLVSCLFDLGRREPGSARLAADEYLQRGEFLFGLDCDLVVFVDPEIESEVAARRERNGLLSRTAVVPMAFETLDCYAQADAIAAARRRHPLMNAAADEHTPLHTALGWAKLELVRRAIEADPFAATHLAWIDLGIGQSARTERAVDTGVFARTRDRIRLLQMTSFSAAELEDRDHYLSYLWDHVGCAYLSGSDSCLRELCERFVQAANEALERGYGATVDQLLVLLAWQHPQLFDFYYGDAVDALENYDRPVRAPERLLEQLRQCRTPDGWDRPRGRRLAAAIFDSCRNGALECEGRLLAELLEECFVAIYFADYPDTSGARAVVDLYTRRVNDDRGFRDAFLQNEIRVRTNFSVLP